MGNRKFVWILLAWITLSLSQNWFNYLDLGPASVHQWAQADRASVALRFAETNAPIWEPRVHNLKEDSSGISGMEFPLVNYLAGKMYQSVTFNDAYYRSLMWSFMALGFGAACLLLLYLGYDWWMALGIPILFCSSPVLSYYTPNFIPDTASLALSLVGFYGFTRWRDKPGLPFGLLWMIAFLLAVLIKITALIFVGAYAVSMLMESIGLFGVTKRKVATFFWLGVILIVGCELAWLQWSSFLNRKYSSTMFLARPNPVVGFENFFTGMKTIFANGIPGYLSIPGWLLVLVGVWRIKYLSPEKQLFFTMLLLGSLAFFMLMFNQFLHHDYYCIVLLGTAFWLMVEGVGYVNEKLPGKTGRILFISCLLIGVFQGFRLSYIRYEPENRRRLECAQKEQLEPVGDWVRKNLKRNDDGQIVYLYDQSINASLYFLNLRGFQINRGTPDDYYASILTHRPIDLFLVNDTQCFQSPVLSKFRGLELAVVNGIHIYSVKRP